MSIDYLTVDITYNVSGDSFTIRGDANKIGQQEIVEEFLRSQIGEGIDRSEPHRRDVYSITLRHYICSGETEIFSNTGNKGLCDGILMRFLGSLDK